MLVPEYRVTVGDPILNTIARINGNSQNVHEVITGVYEIGHFGSSDFLRGYYERYPENLVNRDGCYVEAYGVCDSAQNLLDFCPMLVNDPDRKFVVTITPVHKSEQSSSGGWRWHKWGDYIGNHTPQHEYLYDEDDSIQFVYCYYIYERLDEEKV